MSKLYPCVLLWWLLTSANAATISLTPALQTGLVGDLVELELVMDFTNDPTIGGGIDIFYSSAILSFASFEFSSHLGDDPAQHSAK